MASLLGLNSLQQLFQGEFGRLAQVDNLPLFRTDSGCHFGDARGNIVRNGDDSVDIRVQQVSGSNRKPEDLDRDSKIDNVHVCVGNGHSRSEHRELHSAHCGDIAYGAVSDHALALEGLENRRVDLANGTAVQRGSIQYLFRYPGDPTTPGIASVPDLPDSKRIAPESATDMPKIPTTPLSYADATPIMANLGGPESP